MSPSAFKIISLEEPVSYLLPYLPGPVSDLLLSQGLKLRLPAVSVGYLMMLCLRCYLKMLIPVASILILTLV